MVNTTILREHAQLHPESRDLLVAAADELDSRQAQLEQASNAARITGAMPR